MSQKAAVEGCESMRLDQLLVYLRFARTRSQARDLIEAQPLRLNRKRVRRISENTSIGDVLTLVIGKEVKVFEILTLPDRRLSAAAAKAHYRELDQQL
ncbi:MAG: S4 domain-containing protein [Pseudomonadota bacterium]